MISDLWNKNTEIRFFEESLKSFASPEKLFYETDDKKLLAYWPRGYKGKKNTLQSRNTLIGNFTEKWTTDLIQNIVNDKGYYAVQTAFCEEIDLKKRSEADVVIAKKKSNLTPEDILLIIEVKMSIVWNWEFRDTPSGKQLVCIGDYKTHQGQPGILRSDSMLKAIGKAINIRVSSFKASTIPIIVLGNTPIRNSFHSKVDNLKKTGVIQGFWSINPNPLDNNGESIKETKNQGFYRFDSYEELKKSFDMLLEEELNFFGSMKTKDELGRIIEIADKEETYEKKAEVFLDLMWE